MDVLCVLAERGDTVTTRQELISRLWPSEFGADEGLTRAISSLRRAIREAGETDAYIETIPKRGYRLLRPVVFREAAQQAPADPASPSASSAQDAPSATDASAADESPSVSTTVAGASGATLPRRRAALLAVPVVLLVIAVMLTVRGTWTDTGGDGAGSQRREASSSPPGQAAIAVLPFRPLTDDPADLHFGDGIAEEVQSLLSRVPDVRVVARSSSFSFRDGTVPPQELGQILGVDYILRGTVRRSDERIRVAVRLIRARDGVQLWSESFDRDLSDVFAVQDEITLSTVKALQIRLGTEFTQELAASPDIDPRAIELFYAALHLWSIRFAIGNDDGMRRPFDALRAAVDLDPDFAAAWATMGYFGTLTDASPAANERREHQEMTLGALERALAIEPDNALAHAGLARWKLLNEYDVEQARYHLDRTHTLKPSVLSTLSAQVVFAYTLGEPEEAIRLIRQMMQLDPLNRSIELRYAGVLAQIGRFDEAFEFFDECQTTRCLGAGFVTFASTAAYLSQDEARLARWKPVALEFLEFLSQVPESQKPKSAQLLPALFADWFALPDREEAMAAAIALLEADPITDNIGIWGPTIARYATLDLTMDLIELATDRGELLSALYAMSPYYGFDAYPQALLSSPRYRRLWQREGLRDIAALRRQAGETHGLPTPTPGNR
jgi:TolB-like protein/DNA-binding winged helix-turn-helix (wHTH) protein